MESIIWTSFKKAAKGADRGLCKNENAQMVLHDAIWYLELIETIL